MIKKDIVWLDYARMTGILLVVFGHSLQSIPDWGESTMIRGLWDYIYLFHMPLFFIISGYLYKRDIGENLRTGGGKLLYSLILPYIIYQLAYTPFFLIRHISEITNPYLLLKMLMGILDGDGYNTPFSMYVCLPCWFIMCIVQIRVLFLFVRFNRVSALFLSLLAIIFLVIRRHYNLDFYFCIDCTIMAIPYFLSGYYLRMKFNYIQKINSVLLFCLAILCGIVVYIDLMKNGAAQMIGPSYGNYILPNYLAGFLGSIMIFLFSIPIARLFKARAFVKTISRNTLFIIFFHWIMLWFFGRLLHVSFLYGIGAICYVLCAFMLSVGVLLVSDFVINKWCDIYPIVFGKKKLE